MNGNSMKSGNRNMAGLLLATTLLAACAPVASREAALASCPPPAAQELGERAMLRYHGCIRALSPDKLAREYDRVNRHFIQTGSGADRVKLAMLLAQPDTPFNNIAAAQKLLAASAPQAAPVPAALDGLAQLLSATLARQQALDDKVRGLEKDLAAEKQHSDALQTQIDSIKNLERDMTRRDMR